MFKEQEELNQACGELFDYMKKAKEPTFIYEDEYRAICKKITKKYLDFQFSVVVHKNTRNRGC